MRLSIKASESSERDFPGGSVVKNLPANAEDTDSIPGLGRSHVPVEQLKPGRHSY